MEVTNNIQEILDNKDMQVVDIENITGLNRNYLYDVKSGRRVPGVGNAIIIARALNKSVEEVWEIKKDPLLSG